MDPLIEKIILLTAFGMVMMGVNLKAGSRWLALLTLCAMVACLGGAAWFVLQVAIS